MYEERLDALVRHWRIEIRHVDADGNKNDDIESASTSLPMTLMIRRPIMDHAVRTTSAVDCGWHLGVPQRVFWLPR